MKRGTPEHSKTRLLARRLGRPLYAAVGLLELLWHTTARQAQDGAIGRYSDEEIAAALDWDGQPEELVAALVGCRFLDAHPDHRLVVHDWPEHADDATHMAVARSRGYFANGEEPKLRRFSLGEKKEAEAWYGARRAHGVRTDAAHVRKPCSPPPPPPPPVGKEEEKIRGAGDAPAAAEDPPEGVDIGTWERLLRKHRSDPPHELDEREAWLQTFLPEIEAAAEAETPHAPGHDPPRSAVQARTRKILLARWRVYLDGPRKFRGAGEREERARKRREWEAKHGESYDRMLDETGGVA